MVFDAQNEVGLDLRGVGQFESALIRNALEDTFPSTDMREPEPTGASVMEPAARAGAPTISTANVASRDAPSGSAHASV